MENYIKLVDEKLDDYLRVQYPESIFESMRYTVLLPGKRLRPVLCLEACRIFGGNVAHALPAACAIEMLHAQSLIHDDLPCMDNDDFRRGKPSNHKVFGEAVAVLAGDALLTFAPQMIIENSALSAETTLRIIKEYCKAAGAYGLIAGQIVDIRSETQLAGSTAATLNPQPSTLSFIQTHKTAVLFKLALRTGAMAAGAGEDKIAAMTDLGQKLGTAFQIADDILDETSTFEQMGKTLGKDKDANKLTAVSLYGLEGAKQKLHTLTDECFAVLKTQNIQSKIFEKTLNKIRI
ncbi:MAG: polyprenyl synthetase family protein [Heliobacteriaceae bacterium]|jgi:geranylgeranyl diphosphate synthase type II|nr:polyprenyl synthetase family protein [Heliobacteriaceae bacterium]